MAPAATASAATGPASRAAKPRRSLSTTTPVSTTGKKRGRAETGLAKLTAKRTKKELAATPPAATASAATEPASCAAKPRRSLSTTTPVSTAGKKRGRAKTGLAKFTAKQTKQEPAATPPAATASAAKPTLSPKKTKKPPPTRRAEAVRQGLAPMAVRAFPQFVKDNFAAVRKEGHRGTSKKDYQLTMKQLGVNWRKYGKELRDSYKLDSSTQFQVQATVVKNLYTKPEPKDNVSKPDLDAAVLGDKYWTASLLAVGGQAKVFVGRSLELGNKVVLKVYETGSADLMKRELAFYKLIYETAPVGLQRLFTQVQGSSTGDLP